MNYGTSRAHQIRSTRNGWNPRISCSFAVTSPKASWQKIHWADGFPNNTDRPTRKTSMQTNRCEPTHPFFIDNYMTHFPHFFPHPALATKRGGLECLHFCKAWFFRRVFFGWNIFKGSLTCMVLSINLLMEEILHQLIWRMSTFFS